MRDVARSQIDQFYTFGIILGLFWDHFRMTLGAFWDYFGIMLGSFSDDFGIVWDHFRIFTTATLRIFNILSAIFCRIP